MERQWSITSTGLVGLFALVGLYLLARHMWLDLAIWILLGGGMALSLTRTPEAWRARPRWRRWTAVALTVAGLGLFAVQIWFDIRA